MFVKRVLRPTLLIGALLLLHVRPSAALDFDLSAFGTVGYARSNQSELYQRFIDDDGTFERDSLLGLQLDLQLAPAWSATLQATLAPALDSDSRWQPTLTWAFLSWRPDNDWLIRAGRLRLPLLLHSANKDVGATYEFSRLPEEVYSLTPVSDLNALSVSRSWLFGDNELTLDTFFGRGTTFWRFYLRDGFPPDVQSGPNYETFSGPVGGFSFTLLQGANRWRAGWAAVRFKADSGPSPIDFPFVSIAPGVGYYQTIPELPGPGLSFADRNEAEVITLGADLALPGEFRLMAEYARRRFKNITSGVSTDAGYIALLKPFGRWTPYFYWSTVRTDDEVLDLYQAVNGNRVPDGLPGAAMINAAQRLGADQLAGYDQDTWAIGVSYDLSHGSRLKAEWARTRIGVVSYFLDVVPGEDNRGETVDVVSLSYSFSF